MKALGRGLYRIDSVQNEDVRIHVVHMKKYHTPSYEKVTQNYTFVAICLEFCLFRVMVMMMPVMQRMK